MKVKKSWTQGTALLVATVMLCAAAVRAQVSDAEFGRQVGQGLALGLVTDKQLAVTEKARHDAASAVWRLEAQEEHYGLSIHDKDMKILAGKNVVLVVEAPSRWSTHGSHPAPGTGYRTCNESEEADWRADDWVGVCQVMEHPVSDPYTYVEAIAVTCHDYHGKKVCDGHLFMIPGLRFDWQSMIAKLNGSEVGRLQEIGRVWDDKYQVVSLPGYSLTADIQPFPLQTLNEGIVTDYAVKSVVMTRSSR
jgi:hypothetical protein